eukprot:4663276-Ditylum_brightwellii.AAC.1
MEGGDSVNSTPYLMAQGKNQPKFGFAGIIESKSMPKISSELLKNSQIRKNSVGLPTALAINSKFIAIGTQR